MPGVRWNLGKRGSSLSFGVKGLRTTFGRGRRTTTVSLPGTGLSYTSIKGKRPRTPPSTPPRMAKNKQAGCGAWFAIVFGVLFVCSLLNRKSGSPSPSSYATPASTYTGTPPVPIPGASLAIPATPAPAPAHVAGAATPLSVPTFDATLPVSTPLPASSLGGSTTGRALSFRPKTVRLVQAVDLHIVDKGTVVGSQHVAAGAVVRLSSIKRDKVVIELNGGSKEIPATSTDLVEQMVEAAGQ